MPWPSARPRRWRRRAWREPGRPHLPAGRAAARPRFASWLEVDHQSGPAAGRPGARDQPPYRRPQERRHGPAWPRRCGTWGSPVDEPDAETFVVTSSGLLRAPAIALFLGNAGTATRFLTAAVALVDGDVVVDGDRGDAQAPDRAAGGRRWARSACGLDRDRLPAGDGARPWRCRTAGGSRSMRACPANTSRPC